MKVSKPFALSMTVFGTLSALACAVTATKVTDWKGELPSSDRHPAQSSLEDVPWGGRIERNRKLEAHLAEFFREISKRHAGKDITVAIPLRFLRSDYHPYGDGQTNASVDFGPAWTETKPLVYGIRIGEGPQAKTEFVFHSSLRVVSSAKKEVDGWTIVTPSGWQDSFAFKFDAQMMPVAKFLEGVPERLRTFAGGRVAPDPEKISGQSHKFPLESLLKTRRGMGYNTRPYLPADIHGFFPSPSGGRTSTGRGWTWVANRAGSSYPFKHLYACFEGRRVTDEARYGVPSGAGWHHVGDPAETIVHSLEKASIPSALGVAYPAGLTPAYGLDGVAIFRMLKPGEAFVTQQGQFHWYAIPSKDPACVEIWVHNCVPDLRNNWGFGC